MSLRSPRTAINWAAVAEPWRTIGPQFSMAVRAIVAGEEPRWEDVCKVYCCEHCDFRTTSQYGLNGHQKAHKR